MTDWNSDHHTTREFVLSAAIMTDTIQHQRGMGVSLFVTSWASFLQQRTCKKKHKKPHTVAMRPFASDCVLLLVPDLLNSSCQFADLILQWISLARCSTNERRPVKGVRFNRRISTAQWLDRVCDLQGHVLTGILLVGLKDNNVESDSLLGHSREGIAKAVGILSRNLGFVVERG